MTASHRWLGIHVRRTSVTIFRGLPGFIGVSQHLRNPGLIRTSPTRRTLHRVASAAAREGDGDWSARTFSKGGNTWAPHHPARTAKHEGAERPHLACHRRSAPRTTTSHKRRGVLAMKGSAVRIRASASVRTRTGAPGAVRGDVCTSHFCGMSRKVARHVTVPSRSSNG
jgi:hypothetical protein